METLADKLWKIILFSIQIWCLNRGVEVMKKNIKFQLNVYKILPARPKNTGTWVLWGDDIMKTQIMNIVSLRCYDVHAVDSVSQQKNILDVNIKWTHTVCFSISFHN